MSRVPSHPGALLREVILPETGMTVTKLAEVCGIARNTLSRIVNEKADISEDIAIRLSRALGSTPEFWLAMQNRHTIWKLRNERDAIYKRIERVEAA
ncbi:MAG: HigA family addiction module antitoxin [Gammaproteobacteria bacterium]|nr:HigA family addiction module antitoxin [Gammaproteobacteria bacterium]MCW8840029.1 HigA family addiction module antitoxin [Gammaproteobacteria bacterium]MCW8958110.1 HigA family addiction module antitoxin [Gammaproteobacteria bacterium]MCW8972060.1 HigA family addiction module antitoxin [Gammaproteobacteria bacterium]MCW8993573.1 HigA family addiction module antitoxin [Gammaproteobacteria bacterium]